MQNLLNELKTLLASQTRFTQEGRMIKQAVIDAAQSLDIELLQLLISHEGIKHHFFQEVSGVLVFDKVKLLRFVSNKAFLEDSYTAFKNKIGLVTKNSDGLYDAYLFDSKEVVLAYPYKDCMLEGGQTKEEEKTRNEIFWNETLAPDDVDRLKEPKAFSNVKRYDAEGVHANITDLSLSDNFIIKGNNLLALYSLLPVYRSKVKLIYIDPPYNTGNDSFRYNDSFKHSTWLTFMKDRLKVARELLHIEGAIFIQISDVELAYLKVLLDETFGKENFINQIAIKTKSPSGFKTVNLGVFETAEYILIYGKNKKEWTYIPQYVKSEYDTNYKFEVENPEEEFANWRIRNIEEEVAKLEGFSTSKEAKKELGKNIFLEKQSAYALKNAEYVFRFTEINDDAGEETLKLKKKSLENLGKVFVARRIEKDDRYILDGGEMHFYRKKLRKIENEIVPTMLLTNIWVDIPYEGIAKEGGVKLKKGKKPEKLIARIINMSTKDDDIVMDFFVGSGTTAAVAHKMKRRFIGIEQLDYIEELPVARLVNTVKGEQSGVSKSAKWQGGGCFIYMELAKANQHFVEQIQSAETEAALLKIWERMQAEAFISYKVTPDMIDKNLKDYEALSIEDKRRFLIETLDKNLLYVPHCDMESKEFGMSETDKKATTAFYDLKNV